MTALPVSKIVAVGRNYADHAREMGATPAAIAQGAAEPILFLKPPSALVACGRGETVDVELPSFSRMIHHEVELVLQIGRRARRIAASDADSVIAAVTVGLDLTARDLQAAARKAGDPWCVAKGFDQSAPIGPLVALREVGDVAALGRLTLSLAVNGTQRQRGSTADLLTPIPELVAFISSRFTLEPGDLLFTGTPAGVGPLVAGDLADARLTTADGRELAALSIRCRAFS